jgi:hypothetical protein
MKFARVEEDSLSLQGKTVIVERHFASEARREYIPLIAG